jgi:hypothetical protein
MREEVRPRASEVARAIVRGSRTAWSTSASSHVVSSPIGSAGSGRNPWTRTSWCAPAPSAGPARQQDVGQGGGQGHLARQRLHDLGAGRAWPVQQRIRLRPIQPAIEQVADARARAVRHANTSLAVVSATKNVWMS